ncbi:MAG: hypothetical protein H6923_09075 [Alphaproteobacteria bacterium]|nr:hypothetical protein [Alphaproteobacteria bacterium]
MNATISAQLLRLLVLSVPFGLVVLFILASALPLGSLGAYALSPNFGFAAMVYWGLRRPDLFPPLSVFLAGLAHDLIGGGPLGLWAAAYLAGYAFVLWQRVLFIGRAAFPVLVGVGFATAIGLAVAWAGASWRSQIWLDVGPVAVHAILTVACFPLVAMACSAVEERLPAPE